MPKQMNLLIPKGYQLYGGADFSGYPDAEGSIFYSSSARFPDGKTFGQIVVRVKNNVAEVIPLPEFISSRGQLSWNPAGLFLFTFDVDNNGPVIPKVFQINQFKQFTNGFPVVVTMVNTAVSSVDNEARNIALNAKTVADGAKGIAENAKSIANAAKSIAEGRMTKDQVWSLINDRLYGLFNAWHNNDRRDALDASSIDIVYAKVNDWIYGKLKDMKLIP